MESLTPMPMIKFKNFNSFSSSQKPFVSSYSTKQLSMRSSLLSIHQLQHSSSNQALDALKSFFKNKFISRKIGLATGFKVNQLSLTLLKPKTIDPEVISSPIILGHQILKNTNSNFNNKYNFKIKKLKETPQRRNSCPSVNVNINSKLYKTIFDRRTMKHKQQRHNDKDNKYYFYCNNNICNRFERNYDKTLLNSKKYITVNLLQR